MESISALLQSPISNSSWLALILFIGFIVFFGLRTGSAHALLERAWRLMVGKEGVADRKLREFIEDTRDLERFRFLFSLKVETKEELYHFLEWLKSNKIYIGKAQRVRRWINIQSDEIISCPPKKFKVKRYAGAMLLVVPLVLLSPITNSQSAFLQMRESGVYFLSNANKIESASVLSGGWEFGKDECSKNMDHVQTVTEFSHTETKVICEALKGEELKQFVGATVKSQRVLGIVLMAVVGIAIAIFMYQGFAAELAEEIYRKVNPSASAEAENSTEEHS